MSSWSNVYPGDFLLPDKGISITAIRLAFGTFRQKPGLDKIALRNEMLSAFIFFLFVTFIIGQICCQSQYLQYVSFVSPLYRY